MTRTFFCIRDRIEGYEEPAILVSGKGMSNDIRRLVHFDHIRMVPSLSSFSISRQCDVHSFATLLSVIPGHLLINF